MKIILSTLFVAVSMTANAQSGMKYVLDMVHNNPGEKPYVTKYNNPEFLRSQGFNGAVTHWHINCAITYDHVKKGLIKDKQEREWIEKRAVYIDEKLAEFHKAGIKVYPFTDFIVFPKSLWAAYGDEIRLDKSNPESYKPDMQSRKLQQLLRAQIDGIFRRFPTLDGLTLRFGETYLHDTPYHLGNSPIGKDGIHDHITLLKILREEVCVKRGKMLFYRTWDFGFNFHNSDKYYLSVTDSIEPHPNLVFSIKYQQDDYHRMTPFNPCLGKGRHQQIVESQSRMEAYGKGAHPYYIGKGVIEGWPETKYVIPFGSHRLTDRLTPSDTPRGVRNVLMSGKINGVVTWSNGGGWQGPYITHEIWTDLNTYVVAQWAINPSRTEEEIFSGFTDSIGFKGRDADMFRQIALLSVEGVRKGHCNSYTANDVWWTRDEFFSARQCLKDVDEAVKNGWEQKILAEKDEAVAIWLQIEALSRQLSHRDNDLLEAIRVSCSYGRIKYQLIREMWIMMLADGRMRAGKDFDKGEIRSSISRYNALWAEWKRLKESSEWCATLYTDLAFRNNRKGSIGELVERLSAVVAE